MKTQPISLATLCATLVVTGLFFEQMGLNCATTAQESTPSSQNADREANGNRTGDQPAGQSNSDDLRPTTATEARIRARMLHETIAGSLQVMHRDFFREDQKRSLPSKSLEDVFVELAKRHNIELRWLAVNADAMTIDHEPRSDFDKQAIAELTSGKDEFSTVENDMFQFAGSIRLSASCVKCHVRNRASNEDRKAALIITMPLRKSK